MRFLGSRVLFFVPLATLLAFLLAPKSATASAPPGDVTLAVEVYSVTPANDGRFRLNDPALAARLVRESIAPVLAQAPARLGIEAVRHRLFAVFGSAVKETVLQPSYFWWWNGERWIIICSSDATFEVDVPGCGVVEVEVEERTEM